MEYIPPMMLLGGESDEYMEILLDIDNLAVSVARSLENCSSSVNNRRNRTTLRLCLEVMDTLYSPKSTHSKSYREIVDQAHSEYALVPTMRLVARHTHFIGLLSALQSQQHRGKLVIHEHELIAHIRDGISIILGKYLYEPTLRRILKETLVDLSTLGKLKIMDNDRMNEREHSVRRLVIHRLASKSHVVWIATGSFQLSE